MAAPVQRKGEAAIGVITVAGPLMRLTEQRMLERGLELLPPLAGRTEPALETVSS